MTDLIGKKWLFFIFSGIVIIPGILSLIFWGLKPAIDFTGGTLFEFKIQSLSQTQTGGKPEINTNNSEIKNIVQEAGIDVGSIQESGANTYLLRLKPLDKDQNKKLQDTLTKKFTDISVIRSETVGPSVGQETTANAVKAVLLASAAIVFYVAWAFRKIPKPYTSYKFGICAVIALLHDVLVIVGIFSIFGHFFKVEVDSLFITALLTIMGFSVHDTIVVFDRIRENLFKMSGESFANIVNESILQTLARSFSTSLTVLFTLLALFLFGGESIKWFTVALLIGITSGTYSSVFNAAPLLVIWEERGINKK
jgi:preprotein translocase subunit SecF